MKPVPKYIILNKNRAVIVVEKITLNRLTRNLAAWLELSWSTNIFRSETLRNC